MTQRSPDIRPDIRPVRSAQDIAAATGLVWEFFDVLRERYPEMLDTIDAYITEQDVAGELDRFPDVFLPPKGECFVAFEQDQPAGLIMLKPHGDTDGELNRMYVQAKHRGKGLGRALCQAAIAEARRLGYHTLWLDALFRHVEALPLYESLGFTYYTDPSAFGADDERVLHMTLPLKDI